MTLVAAQHRRLHPLEAAAISVISARRHRHQGRLQRLEVGAMTSARSVELLHQVVLPMISVTLARVGPLLQRR